MPLSVVSVIGARPQFIKASVVSHALRARDGVTEQIIHTGQHFDANMSKVFFDELSIPKPDYSLDIHSLPHGAMTGRMLESIEAVLMQAMPDWVVVYGDTNSTLAASLAASKLHIPVAHIEAGLRSFNRRMPEEINRIVSDHVADLLLVPTAGAVANLLAEGIAHEKIVEVGDVMYDCAMRFGEIARTRSTVLDRLGLSEKPFILCTAHRAENTDDPLLLRSLVDALGRLAADYLVVMPIHPRTRAVANRHGIDLTLPGLILTDPVGYLDMVRLEQSSALVLTDSGGVQKEAFFHGVPCVTIRDQTEWSELVESGWNVLAPLREGSDALVDIVRARLGTIGTAIEPYGRGDAASRIVAALENRARRK
ncbi:MAG: UDP-N-acetylglucosamine 2-epimerase (non-hydrolyzing) [Burkholderiaceae bacterium]